MIRILSYLIITLASLVTTVLVAQDDNDYKGKAIKLTSDNSQLILFKDKMSIGNTCFLGGDTAVFCKDFEKALELFINFKEETKFYPQ